MTVRNPLSREWERIGKLSESVLNSYAAYGNVLQGGKTCNRGLLIWIPFSSDSAQRVLDELLNANPSRKRGGG